MRMLIWTVVLALCAGGCERSSSTATAPSPTDEKLKQDLKAVGADLKEAASQAATEVKPALQNATEQAREAIHRAAEKVATRTATQPGDPPPLDAGPTH